MKHYSLPLVVGVVGCLLGMSSIVLGTAWPGAAAGLAALIAGTLTVTQPRRPADATPDDDAQVRALTDDLEASHRQVVELQGALAALTQTDRDSDTLAERTAALTDEASGLFSEAYFHVALESRLASARRHLRPVAVTLLRAIEGPPGDTVVAPPPSRLADAICETIRDADIACRLEDGTFAVVLEDTPENGAVWTTERIRRHLVSRHGTHTVWAGIACYPAHAFSGSELFHQASAALAAAQEWRQDRIEVALSE